MYAFGELKNTVAVLVGRSDDTNYKTKIGVWLQLSHKLLVDIYDYWLDLQDTFNFSTIDGRQNYPLPNRFDKPFRLYDLTNKKKITIITEEEYSDDNISNIASATEGIPEYARIFGTSGSSTEIVSTGTTVKVKSSDNSETVAIIVRIKGYTDSSLLIEDSEEITIPVASSDTYVAGTKTFYKITSISKSSNSDGYITIAQSDNTVLEYLAPEERIARHKVLRLGLIPNSVYSMRLLFKKTIEEMVDDYDYPFTECSRFLILDAFGWSLSQDTKFQEAGVTWGKAEQALKLLLTNQNSKLGTTYIHKAISIWASAHRR